MATFDLSSRDVVDAIKPKPKPVVYYDGSLAGFGLRVMPAGGMAWIVEYRPNGGGREVGIRRMTIAPASVMAPDKARNAAKDILAAARLGGDPAKARTKGREMETVRQFSATFMDEHVSERLKPGTQVLYKSHFDRFINPIIGSIKLDCVTKADVSKMHRQIARSGIGGKRREGAANHALVTLSSMYGFAMEEEVLPIGTNPVHKVKRYVSNFSERYLTLGELGASEPRCGKARQSEYLGRPQSERFRDTVAGVTRTAAPS